MKLSRMIRNRFGKTEGTEQTGNASGPVPEKAITGIFALKGRSRMVEIKYIHIRVTPEEVDRIKD